MCNQDEIAGHRFVGVCLCQPTNPRTHVAACLQILHNLLLFFDFFGDLCAHVHKFHHQLWTEGLNMSIQNAPNMKTRLKSPEHIITI